MRCILRSSSVWNRAAGGGVGSRLGDSAGAAGPRTFESSTSAAPSRDRRRAPAGLRRREVLGRRLAPAARGRFRARDRSFSFRSPGIITFSLVVSFCLALSEAGARGEGLCFGAMGAVWARSCAAGLVAGFGGTAIAAATGSTCGASGAVASAGMSGRRLVRRLSPRMRSCSAAWLASCCATAIQYRTRACSSVPLRPRRRASSSLGCSRSSSPRRLPRFPLAVPSALSCSKVRPSVTKAARLSSGACMRRRKSVASALPQARGSGLR
mmetsp:Transcript_23918/g.75348  ORF Transcript_23918/g.75348 Transcript_23918/m.75348 type:complete len:268 (-) Transcript_23918:2251-3054(-)